MKAPYLEVGKIINTHGVHGEVKITPWCDTPEDFLALQTLYVDNQPVKLRQARVHKGTILALLEGVEDLNSAMRLKGKVVTARREDVPLPEGRLFIADLLGLEVRDARDGRVLGILKDVLMMPAQHVYVVEGEKKYLIPAVDAFIVETNLEAGYMLVRLIEGMEE